MWRISSLLGCLHLWQCTACHSNIAFFLISRFIVKTVCIKTSRIPKPFNLGSDTEEDRGFWCRLLSKRCWQLQTLRLLDYSFWLLTPCSHLLCYIQTKDECVFLGGVNSGAIFCGWTFSLMGNISNLSPVYTLNGWSIEELLDPTEKLEIFSLRSSWSLHLAATHQGSPFPWPSTLWTSSHPTAFLGGCFFFFLPVISGLCTNPTHLSGAASEIWAPSNHREIFSHLEFYICSFMPVLDGR